MKLLNELTIEIKKSKFISYYYEVSSKNDIDFILNEMKKNHKKANHITYCYKVGSMIKKTDDGEPKGTAGLPIYNVIDRNNLNNCIIIIVRYFGGTLLGSGNLLRTYSKCANEIIKNR